MAVLRESPWYQEILCEGEARGQRQGVIASIETSLDTKFGRDGLELMPQIAQISDLERLKLILQNIITANTVEKLRSLL